MDAGGWVLVSTSVVVPAAVGAMAALVMLAHPRLSLFVGTPIRHAFWILHRLS